MFKRANKVTALLVAAASMMSVVPAMASDYKKVDSQDGVVYGAVAYKDGTAIIDGEVDGNDGVYFLEDGKYNALDNVDSGSDLAAYGEKYAKVDDGSDYDVDLSNGTVIEDDQPSNDEDDAASSLRKKIKDSDRYNDNDISTTVFGDDSIADLDLLPGNKFSENWYSAKYAKQSGKLGDNSAHNTALAYYDVYTDMKGNYIDANYNLGKIKVSTTASGTVLNASVDIENTNDIYDVKTAGDTHAEVTKAIVLGQDADSIYRYAIIAVTSTADANGQITINNKAFNAGTANALATVNLNVIQKISKAQASGDVDDAKYAKSVYNYVISDDSAKDTGTDAQNYLALASNNSTSAPTKAAIINGKLALSKVNDSVSNADNVTVQTATLKQKNGYYYTDLESQTTIQGEYSSDLNKVAADTDVDGNIYVLDGGYVKVFDGTDDWNKVYKVDGSFDSLSAYDKDNMVAWSQGDEIYSVIGGKTTDTTTPTTPVVTAGWAQAANGAWTYNKADGTKATGWLLDGATWYYLKADGVMATGWVQDGATWYYTNASGAMQTGWINDNGTWYYTNASGAMLANTTVDGYVLGASGAWVK